MQPGVRLSSEERRAAIIKAVRKVFAQKGFVGATTRELADAAGVSEALLFKHFPNKEALFAAMQRSCCTGPDLDRFERIAALEPSSSTLVLLVHFLVSRVIDGCALGDDQRANQNRLVLRSLAEDGEFARLLLGKVAANWVPKVEDCLKAAVASGEAARGPILPSIGGWFAHHLAAAIALHSLPAMPAVDYGAPPERLVEQAVWFALRGMGLKEGAIRRYYNPQALALLND